MAFVARLGKDLTDQVNQLTGRGGAILSTAEGDESDRIAYFEAVAQSRRIA